MQKTVRDALVSAFAKCKRFGTLLKERGLTPNIVYYSEEGYIGRLDEGPNPRRDPEELDRIVTKCAAESRDPQLNEWLDKVGKDTGVFSTTASIEINKRNIPEGDIPFSLATCGNEHPRGEELHASLQDLMGRCDISELHAHDGNTPSVHLHIECKDSSMDTLEAIADVIKDANKMARDFCPREPRRRSSKDVMF